MGAAAEPSGGDSAALDAEKGEPGDELAEAKVFPLPDLPPKGGVIAYYYDNAMVELVSPQGVHVFIDVYSPAFLTREATSEDILLSTHTDMDHYDAAFFETFPGHKIHGTDKGYRFKDVTISVVPSAHDENQAIAPEGAWNYLYLIDLGGMRVAHFGDIGQAPLSPAQLAVLGRVDILFTQFYNTASDMLEESEKGFDFVAQVKARLIVPCHSGPLTHEKAKLRYKALCSESAGILVTPEVFGDKPVYVLMGSSVYAFKDALGLALYEETFPSLYARP
jgi:hypothetical protein